MVNFTKFVISLATLLPLIAALPVADNADNTAGKYIITFKRGLKEEDMTFHIDYANEIHSRSLARRGLSKGEEQGVRRRFNIHEHRSYSAVFDVDTIEEIARHPAVEAVEADELFHIDSTSVITQSNAPWGLSSISHDQSSPSNANATKQYRYYENGQGQGVFAYVVDSGIRISHKDFEGRAVNGVNFVGNETFADMNGHGTHVAGTIGSKTYGVAKKATLIAVKVIHQGGSATSEDLLSAYQWILDDGKKNKRISKSVINISIGGPSSKFYIDAMENLHKAGFAVFVSAGNSNIDASKQSPANAPSIFTVASITADNVRSSFSNFGKLVDIFAPGSAIVSLGHTSDTAIATKSGTSMAAPHAAGEAASLKSLYGSAVDAPDMLYKTILGLAVKGVVKDPMGSPNVLLANGLGQAKNGSRSIPITLKA